MSNHVQRMVKKIAPSARFLKKAASGQSPATVEWIPGRNKQVSDTVAKYLDEIETIREPKVMELANQLDKWPMEKNVLLTEEEIQSQIAEIPQEIKDDIEWQCERVSNFARMQRDSIKDFEVDLGHGVFAGQKTVPMNTVGCYVPGGRYSHVSSAIMTIAVARVAGVKNVIAASPPKDGKIHGPTLYAMKHAGADHIFQLGGVQAIATMAFGLWTDCPADTLVGPGNAYVAEAKRLLFGRVGIDVFAGPTETCLLIDETSDPWIAATDLISQAEHGLDSPAWLISTDEAVAQKTLDLIPKCVEELVRDVPSNVAGTSWKDYGEVIVVDTKEECAALSDHYAPEHLQVLTSDLDWYHENLHNYGSLFLGEETCVTYGDKISGPNHVLPTKGAARYSPGLSVHKYLKPLTYQRNARGQDAAVCTAAARISRLEGMEGHARSSDVRVEKYYPEHKGQLHHKCSKKAQ